MPGAIATNFHEGSRSEYLAQYVFASFGTAAAIPHPEDTGVDLHCTVAESIGGRSWARSYYSVQVKSDLKAWDFATRDSVRWLIKHPLPLFLALVDKGGARIRVYHTLPRFLVWSCPPLPDRLKLVPATEEKGSFVQWNSGTEFSLGAPILDFTIADFLDDKFRELAKRCLCAWISVERDNLRSVDAGILQFTMPAEYRTNEADFKGIVRQGTTKFGSELFDRAVSVIRPQVAWLGAQMFSASDVRGAVRAALLYRYLGPEGSWDSPGLLHEVVFVLHKGLGTQAESVYDGLDRVGDAVDRLIESGSEPAMQ